ncbi:MAG: hypothetical protein EBU66_08115 [Bacteroidetes bacterium]|nr:hypothetical protein [bacterium]NBP64611.1 hypothetical protein [Bacteroidota bacterium]
MDPSIKSLTITGSAAEDATRSRLKAAGLGSRRKRTPVKDEEDEFIEQAKNFTLQNAEKKAPIEVKIVPKVELKLEPKPELKSVILQPKIQEQRIQEPKLQETNVILNPPKQSRVKLQPKVHSNIKEQINTTRKARRIKLNLSNLTHRFTRAKKVKDDTEKKPIESVREYLIQKGVIQAKSKAPEKMLRSMYADFLLLKDQAL